jgi:voltage-gated potassium channel
MAAKSYRRTWFEILHKPLPTTTWAKPVNQLLFVVILANCIAVAVETVPSIYDPRRDLFFYLEAVSTGLFLVEYCLRIWVCVEIERYSQPVMGRIRYALRPLLILDLIVVVTYFAPVDLRFLRVFRLTRLLRILDLEEFDRSMHAVWVGIARRRHLLIGSATMMFIAAYFAAAMLYMVEHAAQPDRFGSVPATLWWAIVTLTTIGYGDITPITPLGKILAGFVIIVGIGIFALPTAIVTAAILEAGDGSVDLCPHCGKRKSEWVKAHWQEGPRA